MNKALPFIIVLFATPALAQSNIGLATYPAPQCEKPAPVDPSLKPSPPPANRTDQQADDYNVKVVRYNAAMRARNDQVKAFNACMQAYVEAGNADIKRIQSVVNTAVEAANSP